MCDAFRTQRRDNLVSKAGATCQIARADANGAILPSNLLTFPLGAAAHCNLCHRKLQRRFNYRFDRVEIFSTCTRAIVR